MLGQYLKQWEIKQTTKQLSLYNA